MSRLSLRAALVIAGALGVLCASLAAPAGEQKAQEQPTQNSPRAERKRPRTPPFRFAVFAFANETIYPELDYLQLGLRDIVRATLAEHEQIELISARAIDRAVRRLGYSPYRAIPPAQALRVARELDADFCLVGLFCDGQQTFALRASLVKLGDPPTVWPIPHSFDSADDAPGAGQRVAEMAIHFAGLPPLKEYPSFLRGQRLRVVLSADAAELSLALAPGQGAELHPLRYNIAQGRNVRAVAAAPTAPDEPGRLRIALAQPKTHAVSATVELDVLLARLPQQAVRLRAEKVGQGSAEIAIYNLNRPDQPELVRRVRLDAQTASTEFFLDCPRLRANGPVFCKAAPFGRVAGSLPLASEAEKEAGQGKKPAQQEPAGKKQGTPQPAQQPA